MAKKQTGEQYLYLTTRGRKSRLPREIEIWFTSRGGRYYVIAEYPTSHWVQNLLADARVRVRVGTKTFAAQAHVLSAESESELQRAVHELSRKKYGSGEGLVVELIPQAISGASRCEPDPGRPGGRGYPRIARDGTWRP